MTRACGLTLGQFGEYLDPVVYEFQPLDVAETTALVCAASSILKTIASAIFIGKAPFDRMYDGAR